MNGCMFVVNKMPHKDVQGKINMLPGGRLCSSTKGGRVGWNSKRKREGHFAVPLVNKSCGRQLKVSRRQISLNHSFHRSFLTHNLSHDHYQLLLT